jgi:sigma-B regulation protein RsbU (phosphoserine phosphatase)
MRGASGDIFTLHARGLVMGLMHPIPLMESHVTIEPGDVLLMYTDGITDALNAQREEFGNERLTQLLLDNRHRSASEIADAIVAALHAFVGDREAFDDMTLVALKRVG